MIGVLVLVGAALGVVGAIIHAHRVASPRPTSRRSPVPARGRGRDPCAAAALIALANGASLDNCAVEGFDVRLQVTVTGPRWLGQRHDLSAQARAGPA